MKYILLAFVSVVTFQTEAQNLVPNPSFTLFDTCPYNTSQIVFSRYWHDFNGSSDYFNACSNATVAAIGVPNNMQGHQASASDSYAGLFTYATAPGGGPSWREYFGTDIAALHPGATYKVTLVVSLAESSMYATDGLGIYFYRNTMPSLTYEVIPVTPQIEYSRYGIITDSISWVTISGNFIADSAYTHLLIGCYKPDSLLRTDRTGFAGLGAYYFIDSVAVERVAGVNVTNIDTENNEVLYPNPFSEHATLSFSNPQKLRHTLYIYNLSGSVVKTIENCIDEVIVIDRSDLHNGFYYYQLKNEMKMINCGTLIVD